MCRSALACSTLHLLHFVRTPHRVLHKASAFIGESTFSTASLGRWKMPVLLNVRLWTQGDEGALLHRRCSHNMSIFEGFDRSCCGEAAKIISSVSLGAAV